LTLAPCQQDLRQDKAPVCAKAKFDVWNENEAKLTGAYQCVKCWFEGVLSDIGTDVWGGCNLTQITNGKCKATGVGGSKFTAGVLKTSLGRFRVSPDTFPACRGVFSKLAQDGKTPTDVCGDVANQYKTPFLGVRLTDLTLTAGTGWAGSTGTGAGMFVPGAGLPNPTVKWDPAENYRTPSR